MSQTITHSRPATPPGIITSLVIAAVAAFALGALSAFVSKVAYSNPNAPIAASGAAPISM
jgi:hypothetical protein